MKQRPFAALTAIAMLLVVAGCGESDDASAARAQGSQLGPSVRAMVEAKTVSMTLTSGVPQMWLSVSGTEKMRTAPRQSDVSLRMNIESEGQDFYYRLIEADGKKYLNSGQLSQDQFVPQSGNTTVRALALGDLSNMRPIRLVRRLGRALISFAPTETRKRIDGVWARRYDITFDDATFRSARDDRPTSEISGVMWISGNKLPRRMALRMGGGERVLRADFTKYGEPITITAPSIEGPPGG